jgi:aldose 1-epimerase
MESTRPSRKAREVAQTPSGRQHRIEYGTQRATVVEVGGGLRIYEVDGFPVVDGYAEEEMAPAARGHALIPWPNRLAGGLYRFGEQTHQLPLSEPALSNAIHGLVRWSAWDLIDASPRGVRLGHVLWPQAGYPFTLALELLYELSDLGLRVTITAENAGKHSAPYGAGQHPYIRAELTSVEASVLHVPAETWLETDDRQIPTGRLLSTAGTEYGFESPRTIGSTRLDTAFTGLARDGDGLAWIELTSSDRRRTVAMWLDGAFDYVMAFTGDTLDEAARRRSIALEPMTCAPDAFHNCMGLQVLEPGQRVSASWGLAVRSGPARS